MDTNFETKKIRAGLFSIMAIVGAALAFVGGLLTLIFSASASYSEINAVMKTAKNVNPKGGMSMVSLAQKVAGDAAGFVVNAFEWFRVSGFVWMAIVGIILTAVGAGYVAIKRFRYGEKTTKTNNILCVVSSVVAVVVLVMCLTLSTYSSSLNRESKNMVTDAVEQMFSISGLMTMGALFD